MNFDQDLREQWLQKEGQWQFHMPEGWMQGRSVFGGLTAAVATSLAMRHVSQKRMLRSLNIQLLRPTTPGMLQGTYTCLREGKSTLNAEVRLLQDEQLTALLHPTFVQPRQPSMVVKARARWEAPAVEKLEPMPYIPQLMPEFLQHVDMRFVGDTLPYTGAQEAEFRGYVRFRVPLGGVEGILGLLDAFPCPSLCMLEEPKFASTVKWNVHLWSVPNDLNAWFGFHYETVVGMEGFHTVVGKLFSDNGELIAWSEQLVALFD